MTRKHFWRGGLIVALCMLLAVPAKADQLSDDARNIIIGIVAATAAVVIVTVVIIQQSRKKRTIAGCVISGISGPSVTDEKDRQTYALSGNTADIKPGDRMILHGKKSNPKGVSAPLTWKVDKEIKDFGTCQP